MYLMSLTLVGLCIEIAPSARWLTVSPRHSVCWNWLEAGHDKGPCDGVGGSIKKIADNLVKSGHLIKNMSRPGQG